MAEKILNTRIALKIDTLENWSSSTLPLKKGELALATVAATAGTGLTEPVVMIKVGEDGVKTFKDLPWNVHAKASDVLAACKTEDGLRAFVNNVIANAGIATNDALATLSGRVTTAEGEIDALQAALDTAETGLKARMTAAEGDITALEGLVGEKNVATQISEAIAALNLATTYEAKGEAAKVSTALETYKTSNDAKVLEHTNAIAANTNALTAIKDGETLDSFKDVETALAGKETVGAAAQALTDAKAYADGLAGNYDAKGAAATAESNAKAYAKEYADGLAGNYDAKGAAAQALTDANAYTDGEIAEWVGEKNVATQISEAIANEKLADTYAAKVHTHVKADITDFAHTHEIGEVNGLQDALDGKQAAGDYATKTEAQGYADAKDEAIAAAKKAGDDAQADVDVLETYVGTIPSDEKYADVTSIVGYINKKAEETLASASGNSTETAASVKAALDTYKTENNAAVQANADAIAELEGLVGDGNVSERIENAVKAEKERAEGIEGGLETRLAAVEADYLTSTEEKALQDQITANANAITLLTNGVSADEVDGVNDLIQYVKDHGTEVTGIKADIKANADAIDAIEADYLKAADKTELAGDITALEGRMDDAEAAIGTKAAQADLTALAGRVTTVEGDLNTETTGLKARMTAAEADIDALETKVGDKPVADQITAAIEALKIGDYAKAADLTAAVARIAQNETDIEALEGRMGTAESNIGTLQTDVAKKADAAAMSAIATTGNVNDLVQTDGDVLVFDCGNASV